MAEIDLTIDGSLLVLCHNVSGTLSVDQKSIDVTATAQTVLDALLGNLLSNPTIVGNSLTPRSQTQFKSKLVAHFTAINATQPPPDPAALTIVITIVIGKVTITITIKF
jgi:flagellar motor switch protein FliM